MLTREVEGERTEVFTGRGKKGSALRNNNAVQKTDSEHTNIEAVAKKSAKKRKMRLRQARDDQAKIGKTLSGLINLQFGI